jgi:hypothetical protein
VKAVDRIFFFLFALIAAYLAVVCSLPFLPEEQESTLTRALVQIARWMGLYQLVEWSAKHLLLYLNT